MSDKLKKTPTDNVIEHLGRYIKNYEYEIQETVEHYPFDLIGLKIDILNMDNK